jgi:urease accessory protein
MEAACTVGLVTDAETLRSFLYGRLRTAGVIGAVVAAAVCARVEPSSSTSVFRAAEAELDARIPSPAARTASRTQGSQVLRLALTVTNSVLLDTLARATVGSFQRPHYPVAIGTVAKVAGATPEEAAEAAAYASVAGPAFAAQSLLHLDANVVTQMGVEMAPEVIRVASDAAMRGTRPLSEIPAFGAPALEYLAEEHVTRPRSFAS